MAENYNFSSRFGLNVTNKGANKIAQSGHVEAQVDAQSLFSPVDNFFEKYESVLNGDVQHDVNMYSRQNMIIAMNLKASDGNIRKFDVSI